ncbi:MAG: HPr family phosphocarrier protein [Acidobacteriota bacterium]
MIRTAVSVVSDLGLHARAAARLVRLVSGFQSQVKIARQEGDSGVDARSILGLLLLAAAKGTTLYVTIEGDDEAQAAAALTGFFQRGFGEEQ